MDPNKYQIKSDNSTRLFWGNYKNLRKIYNGEVVDISHLPEEDQQFLRTHIIINAFTSSAKRIQENAEEKGITICGNHAMDLAFMGKQVEYGPLTEEEQKKRDMYNNINSNNDKH